MKCIFSKGLHLVPKNPLYFQFPALALRQRLVHGIFTRHGGTSSPPFHTLNISDTVGDRPESVAENIQKIKQVLSAVEMVQMDQFHGNDIFVLDESRIDLKMAPPAVDAIITHVPYVALIVKQADCQGVVLYDPKQHVVAVVHCGWRGNVNDILGRVVDRMKIRYGCKGDDLQAAIGPSLGPCCAEFIHYKDIFPNAFERYRRQKNHFDLWALSCGQLKDAGLQPENISLAGICTRCRTDLFFSYRGEGTTGRFGTVAMLKERTED